MTMTEEPAAQRPIPTALGERLRSAREARGLALEAVADKTRVRVEHLRAMEAGRWLELPEPVYTRAYLTLVAKAVGLPAQQVLADYERVAPQPPKTPGRPVLWGPIIISALAALLVLAGAGWYVLNALRERAVHGAQPPAAAVAAANAGQSGMVRLSVTSAPPGAVVYVDRVPLALKTPLSNYPVSAGPSREVRLILPGYEPYTTQLDLKGNRSVSVTLSPVGASTPPGLTGAPKGATPAAAAGASPAAPTPIPRVASPATITLPSAPALASAGAYTFNFSGRSWVHVTDASGHTLFEGIPAQGTSQSFVGPIRVRLGNPSAVKLFKDKVAQSTPNGSSPVDLSLP